MEIYLAIITTVLVITQVIRVWQNRKQLKRQEILVQKELERLGEVTQEDLDTQKQFYRLAVQWYMARRG